MKALKRQVLWTPGRVKGELGFGFRVSSPGPWGVKSSGWGLSDWRLPENPTWVVR